MFDDLEEYGVEEEENMIILTDEDGREVEFLFLDLMEYEGRNYVVLLPPEEDEVVILQLEDKENEESYVAVEDSELLDTLFCIFKEKFQDEFEFTD